MCPQNSITKFLLLFLLLWITACGGGKIQSSDEAREETPPETVTQPREAKKDSTFGVTKSNLEQTGRKFVRTAEMRFQAKNVQKATEFIEDITIKYKGFITTGKLKSMVIRVVIQPLSKDSLLETKFFRVENEVIVRVPNQSLDSLLRDINTIVHFLDYRNIQADDVSFLLLANDLRAKRYNNFEKRYTDAIDKQGQKLKETSQAEDNLLNRQLEGDNNQIQNLSLTDQVNYSTLKIFVYQRESLYREKIPNFNNIIDYRPGIWSRMGDAFGDSLLIFEELVLFLVRIWFVLVILGLVLTWYWRFRKAK